MPASLPDLLAVARQMVTGLNANAAAVAERGLSASAIADGQAKIDLVQRLEGEQETLKGALKSKTAELDAASSDLTTWLSDAVRVVKLAFHEQVEKWTEFGIKAKR
ncbi:MAG: hypothetical protein WA821_08785 [Anaerolineales bacterium]